MGIDAPLDKFVAINVLPDAPPPTEVDVRQ